MRRRCIKIIQEIPEYYKFFNWYDLDNAVSLYNFIQEMRFDGINLEDYPEIKIYYDILINNTFSDEPNMITVDYVINKLKNCLIRYGFAHTTKNVNYKLYYYWFEKGD